MPTKRSSNVYFRARVAWDYLQRFTVDNSEPGSIHDIWINGQEAQKQDLDVIKCWERDRKTVTMQSFDRVLCEYGLVLSDFELWAEERDLDYIVPHPMSRNHD